MIIIIDITRHEAAYIVESDLDGEANGEATDTASNPHHWHRLVNTDINGHKEHLHIAEANAQPLEAQNDISNGRKANPNAIKLQRCWLHPSGMKLSS